MLTLEELIKSPVPVDSAAADTAGRQWDSIAKPLGSLGLLEEDVIRIAALTGNPDVRLDRRALLVFCADNGVIVQGVAQTSYDVTGKVASALAKGTSTINPMARLAGCEVIPVDMGIRDFAPMEGVADRRIGNGTADITKGPAMSREQCRQAIESGAELVRDLSARGVKLIAAGEMGIANTTTASAVTSVLLHLDPENTVGRGAGLSGAGLERKKKAVRTAIETNRPDPADPLDILAKVGGFDLAGMCGAFLGAAYCRIPIVIDGMISSAAALCALRLNPGVRAALLASHISSEPAADALMKALGLEAPIHAGMHLGEGSGAICLLPLLDQALAVYHSGQTFEKLGAEAYTPQI